MKIYFLKLSVYFMMLCIYIQINRHISLKRKYFYGIFKSLQKKLSAWYVIILVSWIKSGVRVLGLGTALNTNGRCFFPRPFRRNSLHDEEEITAGAAVWSLSLSGSSNT